MWKSLSAATLCGVSLLACSPQHPEPSPHAKSTELTEQPTSNQNEKELVLPLCDIPLVPPAPQADTAAFANYAWKQFIALNWPVKADERGVPDCTKPLGSPGFTVWQSYKTTDEIFLPDAEDPGPWNSPVGVKLLQYAAKANASLPVQESIAQAVGGWLIDQNSNPTYYAISVNENSYDYVRTNQYYDKDVVSTASSIRFPTGSLEVKAAWKILTDSDDASRYISMTAQVENFDNQGNPAGSTREATVGLVGFHIVAQAAGYPQWLWATFEQQDNLDKNGGAGSYHNPNCSGSYCEPNISPKTSGQPFTTPNQITRVTPLDKSVVMANTTWQALVKNTPLQYYQLISPQWPTDPNDPGNPQGSPTPGVVANTTMESYIQPISSCMDCHSTARVPGDSVKSNYSFIFLFAQSASQGGAQ